MTWAISPTKCRLGELLTRGDVCHLHADRGDAERCGVLLGGTPELVRLDEVRSAVYRVVWSLSVAASGRPRPARPFSLTVRIVDQLGRFGDGNPVLLFDVIGRLPEAKGAQSVLIG